ncbi:sigma-70 family RNA polymerase sigma factor [Solirubrobacter sp. CPCC 204708]|uniref:Sigma-70 family RNA polymerase sigma factor n=1 Tax=Solirubrobacter deserti TaxID=2282478 RepID=A0ABT4RFK1_9ACTN|nr:sigma-70 family RNA polymerase sigma factor [Solirubrobacter deserti]MBE2318622.1 sigma-70 family RNA polymerase sigma factor [Solirubrobacter deserti]MDA0137080.1 sigma-70 family RNA polymerase sigma factor [Solirubrobacter deserti]
MTDRTEAQPLTHETLARLYALHGDRVFGYCVRMLGCEHDAADALQDTFANLARRGVDPHCDDARLRFYVFAAARNACFDLQRRRRGDASLDALREAGAVPEPVEPRAQPEQAVIDAATRDAVYRALATVSERQRTAWVLREIGDLTYDEVAHHLGMNANSVAQLLHRTRRTLRGAVAA